MYLYIHKINNNEAEQNILLEMCSDAGFRFRNGKGIYGIKYTAFYFESCGAGCFRNFLFLRMTAYTQCII